MENPGVPSGIAQAIRPENKYLKFAGRQAVSSGSRYLNLYLFLLNAQGRTLAGAALIITEVLTLRLVGVVVVQILGQHRSGEQAVHPELVQQHDGHHNQGHAKHDLERELA